MEREGDGRARCGGAGLVVWLEQGAAIQKPRVVPDGETRDTEAGMVRRPVRLLPGPSAIGSHWGQCAGPQGALGRAQETGLPRIPQDSGGLPLQNQLSWYK